MLGREGKRGLLGHEKPLMGSMCRWPSSVIVLRLGHPESGAIEEKAEHSDRDSQTCSEPDHVRVKGLLVRDILYSLRERCRAGTNLLDIDRWAQAMILEAGVTVSDTNYPSQLGRCIGTGAAGEALHRAPFNYRLAEGDLLTLVLTMEQGGIVADSAIRFIVGDELTEFSMTAEVFHARGGAARNIAGLGIDPTAAWAMPLSPQVARAVALLNSEISRSWRVEQLAAAVALSPSQLARRFRTELGISPAAYLRQLRADRMAELLASTRIPVNEAARAVGWANTTIAARAFKWRHGATPRVFAAHTRQIPDNGRHPPKQ